MNLKRIIAAALAPMLIGLPAAAEQNDESRYFDVLANYAANLYIDDSVTADGLLKSAVEEMMKDNPELMYEMIKSAFRSLDDYSEFYTSDEYREYYQRLNNIFYGMGVIIQRRDNQVVIIRIYDGGGAQAAGIIEGDILLEVDGQPITGMNLDSISALVAGEEGTTVNIKVQRGGNELVFDVERRRVEESTVGALVLPSDIGYIEIISFSEGTSDEFATVLADFKEKNINNIILDLRNNPGGLLTSVISIAKQIVPAGVIAQTMYRNEEENATFYSDLTDSNYKFAVLVNGNTASAAEVLTGALQDSGAGFVIGTTTYGKGVIQNVFNLKTGDAFKITTGHYLTRDGHDINGVGIEPDETIENPVKPIDLSRYEEFDYKTKWHLGEQGTGVLAAKQRLSILGYYYGEINDIFDEALESAVYAFQDDEEKLSPYGVLDLSTQATLENRFYVIEVETDEQLYTAYEYLGGNREDLE